MRRFRSRRRGPDDWVTQGDVTLLIAFMAFLALAAIIRFIYDPALLDPERSAFKSTTAWEGISPVDVDTWVWCTNPAMGLWEVISYQNRRGNVFVLNTDDLGYKAWKPEENVNKEEVTSLGARLPAALCGVNIHLFGANGGTVPINGGVIVSVILDKGRPDRQVVLLNERRFDFNRVGEEITTVSFEIDADGNFVLESNQRTIEMRCATSVRTGRCTLSD